MKYTRNAGFTLMELMIVVAILGLLSGLALPAYTNYIVDARRAEARADVLRIRDLAERYYLKAGSYDFAQIQNAGPQSDYYDYSISAGSLGNNSYLVIANAKGTQAAKDDVCPSLGVGSSGDTHSYKKKNGKKEYASDDPLGGDPCW